MESKQARDALAEIEALPHTTSTGMPNWLMALAAVVTGVAVLAGNQAWQWVVLAAAGIFLALMIGMGIYYARRNVREAPRQDPYAENPTPPWFWWTLATLALMFVARMIEGNLWVGIPVAAAATVTAYLAFAQFNRAQVKRRGPA